MQGVANRKFAWSEMQILHSNADFAAGRGAWIRYRFPVNNSTPSSQRLRATYPIQIPSLSVLFAVVFDRVAQMFA